MEEKELRCQITRHLCGTDTWEVNHPCLCVSCQEWIQSAKEEKYTCIFYYGDQAVFRQDLLPKDFPHKGQKLIFHYHEEKTGEEQEFRWIVDELGVLVKGETERADIVFHILPER